MILSNETLFTLVLRAVPALLAAPACGGSVEIGKLAARADGGSDPASGSNVDGGTSGSTADEGGTNIPSGPTASCGAPSGAEALYDVGANGDDAITDFFGDGTLAYVGINYIGNFKAGRVVSLPGSAGGTPVADASPSNVRRMAPAKDRVFFGTDLGLPSRELIAVPRNGGAQEKVPVEALAPFASHPQRSDVFFVTTNSAPTQDVVRSWNPPATATPPAMVLPSYLRVRSVATDATQLGVLVEDTTGLKPIFRVLKPPTAGGGGPYEEVARLDVEVVSNLVVNDGKFYVAAKRGPATKLTVYRFGGPPTTVDQSVIGEVSASADDGARIEVDDAHVYVAHGEASPACGGGSFCSAPLEVVRIAKTSVGVANPPVKVKSFVGAAPGELQYRAFNVDACFLYWYEADKRVFFRQSKASF